MTESKTNTPTSADLAADTSATRRKRLGIVGGVIVLTGIAWGVWHVVQGDDARTTDDAYVNGHVVAITPQVAGAISQVFVDNADRVLAGQTLAEIDASDAHIALDAAQAELGQTVRRVRALFAADARAAATVALRQVELDRARSDLSARQQIVAQGAVTQEEARHAGDAVRMAEAALQAAVQARA
ncbi:biotin/lipoyl-binding protein, partial [Pandoraea sp. ISTKB]|uniref:biotin/lipoyl-binding protein n=1 Tax=Pandoraea sp. ISTKB TaxID=1586708 RepID=UPI001112D5B2